MANPVRFLVLDGYSKEARDQLVAGGASLAANLYVGMLQRLLPGDEPAVGVVRCPQ